MADGAVVNALKIARDFPVAARHRVEDPITATVPALSACASADRKPAPLGGNAPPAPIRALRDLVAPVDILLDFKADRKRSALAGIADLLALGAGTSQGAVLKALLRRERLGSTCIGGGMAIPHARLEGIDAPAAVLARLRRPIPFGASDDDCVDLLLAVIWPEANAKGFVPALARIWQVMRRTELASMLRRSATPEEAHAVIAAMEEARR